MKDVDYLINVVKEASNLIKDEYEVEEKGNNGDLVTNLDLEVEQYIIKRLKEKYKDFDIISEEYNFNSKLTDNCITIDPIDGTINFANNLPFWVIQVGLIKNKKTVAAVIYAPKLNELYYADETGAYLNNKKIHVNDLLYDKGIYSIDGDYRINALEKMHKFKFHFRWFASAGLSFTFVSSGKLIGEVFRNNTPWDYVPGLFLVKQAGGIY